LDGDMAGKSIKTKAYKKKKNKFEKTRDYLKLNFKYPEFSIGCFVLPKPFNMIGDDCPER